MGLYPGSHVDPRGGGCFFMSEVPLQQVSIAHDALLYHASDPVS